MLHSRTTIEAGDLVIIYFTRDYMQPVIVTPSETFHNKYGMYAHEDMVGLKYGSKMHSPPPHSGYVYLLRPSPELWTLSLPHRTQILYMPDISYIINRLGVRPGSTVIEAGTGSGSMTHSLSRTVGPRGTVRSFEYHQVRCEKAAEEFAEHKLDNVVLQHRNVCKDGFNDAKNVQAVFLDLPAPWEAIPHAIKTFKSDAIARICCFSPCLEQVLKTVSALRAEGFEDIFTQEVLNRTHELVPPPPPHVTPPLRNISCIVSGLKEHEVSKQERRLAQMRFAREKSRKKREEEEAAAAKAAGEAPVDTQAGPSTDADTGNKRKLEQTAGAEAPGSAAEEGEAKRAKVDAADAPTDIVAEEAPVETAETATTPVWTEPSTRLEDVVITRPSYEMRGHTSYLTFALYHPAKVRKQLAEQDVVGSTVGTPKRVDELVAESKGSIRAKSEETEYGSDSMDAAMGTLTEEEMIAMGA